MTRRLTPVLLLGALLLATACGHGTAAVDVVLVVDADGDGFPAGVDCDDSNPLVHSLLTVYLDADGDGAGAGAPITTCSSGTVTPGFSLTGNDCDDSDPSRSRWVVLYLDQDSDGVGAGSRSISCLGAGLPTGWTRIGSDFDDLDPAVWRDPQQDELLRLLD